ncbi:MAG: hypothetical protein NT060_01100, partial [Candidatus Omnitrophica bacterium]|nr:hypothetical protein [Candidatus Omnitrophota bacterium]
MKTFAYIVSPLTMKQLKNYIPLARLLPDFLVNPFLKDCAPFKSACFKKIKSIQEQEINGFTVVCPILTRRLGDDSELNTIIEAARLSQRYGAEIIGLSGYAAALADKKYFTVTKKIDLPVTS